MGAIYSAVCQNCGHVFQVNEDGGFTFHVLHCDQCGANRDVAFSDLGELHLRYLKGLDVPYSIVTAEHDTRVRKQFPGEPISEDDYYAEIENRLPPCNCGGLFRFAAPARCPRCRTVAPEPGPDGDLVLYD
jgi:hypothetical protein